MKFRRQIQRSVLALAGLLLLAQNVYALKPSSNATANSVDTGTVSVSLQDAASHIQNLTGGQILSADPMRNQSGKLFYRFKVLIPGGRVKVIKIDPTADKSFDSVK